MLTFADSPTDPPPAPSHTDEEDWTVRDEVNATLLNLLPWGVSIVLHVALVVVAIFVVWTTIATTQQEKVVVPYVRLGEQPGSPLKMTQSQHLSLSPSSARRRSIQPTAASTTNLSPLNQSIDIKTPLIGVMGAPDGQSAAKAAPFGTTLEAGAQFKSTFFGSSGNARRIVFIVDATGSLIDTLPYVIKELKQTIQQLSPRQQFTVIFFRGQNVSGKSLIEAPPAGLKPGDAQVKAKVIDWIDMGNHHVEPGGEANPVAALRQALKYRPELIFLLSDNITGQGQYMINQQNLLDEIKRANTSHTKINTIQFIYKDPLVRAGAKGTMQLIAEQTGGVYKFISAADLHLGMQNGG